MRVADSSFQTRQAKYDAVQRQGGYGARVKAIVKDTSPAEAIGLVASLALLIGLSPKSIGTKFSTLLRR